MRKLLPCNIELSEKRLIYKKDGVRTERGLLPKGLPQPVFVGQFSLFTIGCKKKKKTKLFNSILPIP